MKYLLLAPAIFVAAACGNDTTTTDTAEAPQINTGATAPSAPAPAPPAVNAAADFPQRMAMSDMFEIQSSQLAAERSQNQNVRQFAQEMVRAHTQTSQQMTQILQNVPNAPALPTTLDAQHQERLNTLRQANAERFDQLYIDQQVEAHDMAHTMLRDYAQSGQIAELRTFASQTAPTVQQHLERAREIDQSLTTQTN